MIATLLIATTLITAISAPKGLRGGIHGVGLLCGGFTWMLTLGTISSL